MDVILAFAVTFLLLLFSAYKGIYMAYPLLSGLIIFILVSLKRGFRLKDSLSMALNGGKKSIQLIKIFVLIGVIIAYWMAGGTIAGIVYYGITLINPSFLIFSAFLVSSAVSFILGTSFGTAGTIGMAFIVLARSGHININLAAGAIIAGAFFGDRCSPMSSSANLVASLTDTEIYRNIKNMMRTSILPFIISGAVYFFLSLENPLKIDSGMMGYEISRLFNIGWVVFIPAAIIIMLSLFKINIKLSMTLSILSSVVIGVLIQHRTLGEMLKYALTGYNMTEESFLGNIIHGGGIISMLKVSLMVIASSAYAGIFEGTGMLRVLESLIEKMADRLGLFPATMFTSTVTACFGCSQALAIILTEQLVRKQYEKQEASKYDLAVDVENTAVVMSPLVPWNISGVLPAAALSVGPGFILYAFYLHLLPVLNLFISGIKKTRKDSRGKNMPRHKCQGT